MTNILKFPNRLMEQTIKDRFNDLFTRMADAGLSQEQMDELLVKSLKDIGAVEIDGVWRVPGAT
jgi:hypothetical protein